MIILFFIALFAATLVAALNIPPMLAYLPYLVLLVMMAAVLKSGAKKTIASQFAVIAFCFILIGVLVVSVASYDPASSFQRGMIYLVPCFVLYICVYNDDGYVKTFDYLAMLLGAYYSAAVFIAIYALKFGVIESFVAGQMPSIRLDVLGVSVVQVAYGQWPFYRVGGVFGNPNTFGFIGVITISFIFMVTQKRFSKLRLLFGVLAAVGVFLSFSRTSLISLALVVLLALFSSRGVGKLVLAALIGVALVFVYTLFADSLGESRRLGLGFNSREVAWSVLWDSFVDRPIAGHGLSAANEYLLAHSDIQRAHSIYYLLLAEAGIIGVFFLLFIIFISFYPMLKYLLVEGRSADKKFFINSFALMSVFFLSQFFEAYLLSSQLITFLWFTLIVTAWRRLAESR